LINLEQNVGIDAIRYANASIIKYSAVFLDNQIMIQKNIISTVYLISSI
jgi:hypothetical protein